MKKHRLIILACTFFPLVDTFAQAPQVANPAKSPVTVADPSLPKPADNLPADTKPRIDATPAGETRPDAPVSPANTATDKPLSPTNTEPTKSINAKPNATDSLQAPQQTQPPLQSETETDAETKRKVEETNQKILREKAESEAAARKASEEARLQRERERSLFGALVTNSQVFAGLTGSTQLSLNSIHSLGFGLGGFVEYRVFKQYGLNLAIETGQFSAKNYGLRSQDYTLTLAASGTLGFIAITPALQYTLPFSLPVEINLSAGVSIYSLSGGSYSFGTNAGPMLGVSALYTILPRLAFGAALEGSFISAATVKSDQVDYRLDEPASLSRLSFKLLTRYQIF